MIIGSISEEEVAELAKLTRQYNIAPIFLPGDASYFRHGPAFDLFRDLAKRVFAEFCSLPPAQLDNVLDEISHYRFLFEDREAPSHESYLRTAAEYYVAAHSSPAHFDIRPSVFPDEHPDLVAARFPELSTAFDKDGLLVLDERFELRSSGIRYKDCVFHFHQFLRRGFQSNPNVDLVDALHELQSRNQSIGLRIAIDRTRLMPLDAYRETLERDYWWGPPFDESHLDDPRFTGMAVVKRREGTLLERLFAPVERTEFFWFQRDDVKTLEIEEVCRPDASLQDHVLQRYIHAERDTQARCFRHLDGAVKVYSDAQHVQRCNEKLSDRPKALKKPKLFRLDGELPTEDAIRVISLFYRSNEMVIEYFNPDAFKGAFEQWNVPWPPERGDA